MSQRFESEELDDATVEFLRTVHRLKGEGLPGVYLDAKAASLPGAWMPAAGAVIGPILVVVTLFVTVGSVDDPINVAMLQSAGLFLGVWLFVAWMRDLAARKRPDYLGHFKFVDPLYLWHTTGRGVWVTRLDDVQEARVEDNYDDKGNYTGSHVTIHMGRETVVVAAKPMHLAHRLQAFLDVLREEGAHGLPVQRGYDALDELNQREADVEDDYQTSRDEPAPVRRLVEAVPEPYKARSVSTWLRYPVIVVLFVAAFLCSWKLCSVLRDDAVFEIVQGLKPPELRAYLIDPRNKRHRAVVLQRLAAFHEQSAQQIEQRRQGDPQLTAGTASLVRAVSQDAQPVITLRVQQSQKADARDQATIFAPPGMQALRANLVKDLTEHLSPLIGPEITAFGEVENGPAMMEVVSEASPAAGRPGYRIDWTVTLQASPEAPKFVWKTQTEPVPGAPNNIPALHQQYRDFKMRFTGALPAR